MAWGFVAGAAIGVVGGAIASSGAKSAANAQSQSADQATAEQQREFNQTQANQAPWLAAGQGALTKLTAASNGDMSSFQTSPDYNFVRSEGQRDLGNSFAAKGGAYSGNALRALDEFNQNMASTQYGNWWNQQAGLAGVGQQSANTLAQVGANTANQISGNYLAAGNARASGLATQGNILGSTLNGIGSYGAYRYGGNPYGGRYNSGIDPGFASGANSNNALALQGFG